VRRQEGGREEGREGGRKGGREGGGEGGSEGGREGGSEGGREAGINIQLRYVRLVLLFRKPFTERGARKSRLRNRMKVCMPCQHITFVRAESEIVIQWHFIPVR